MPPYRTKSHGNRTSTLRRLAGALFASAVTPEEETAALLTLELARKRERENRSGKYGPRGAYDRPKSEDFIDLILDAYSQREFKAWIRMDRDSFWHLHDLIKDDDVFKSTGNRPQRPVKYQLAAFLIRMGDMSGLKSANVAGIAEGTYYLYAKRVVKAIRRRRDEHLAWPGPRRAEFIKGEMENRGFPGCIGIVDGSLMRLMTKPRHNWAAFWCRKKFYGIAIQAIVDHRSIFTAYSLGWPASVQDTTMWTESAVWRKRDEYFEDDEYILGDRGYPLTKYVIRPFADYDLTNDPQEAEARAEWNKLLSSLRIKVEHAFGLLKGRFPACRKLPGHNLDDIYQLVEALMIIHNILRERGDNPETIKGYNGKEDEEVYLALLERRRPVREDVLVHREVRRGAHAAQLDAEGLYQAGVARRKRLYELYRRGDVE